MNMGNKYWLNDKMTGVKRSIWRKTCPSTTLSTNNPTSISLKLNLGICKEKSVTQLLRQIWPI